jgi:hypothetical protein
MPTAWHEASFGSTGTGRPTWRWHDGARLVLLPPSSQPSSWQWQSFQADIKGARFVVGCRWGALHAVRVSHLKTSQTTAHSSKSLIKHYKANLLPI